jgi:cytochrome d ubiquinol oxidase subunit II
VLLAGYAILDGFDLGVGMLHLFLARNETQRRTLVNAVGPVWDGNEVWLLTGGGALFAAFPAVYATVFSGFYLALMLLLTGLVLRAVSLEFRGKEDSAAWRATWDRAFAAGSLLPALLLGIALGNILRGLPLDAEGEFAGTFLGLLNPFALLVGVTTVALFVLQGSSWLLLKTEGPLRERAWRAARGAWLAFGLLWLAATAASRAAAPDRWAGFASPLAWLVPVLMAGALAAYPLALARGGGLAFLASSAIVAAALGIVGVSLHPFMVPALPPGDVALTIYSASSSTLTLKTMLVIALAGMPVVVGYTIFIYRQFSGPVRLDEASY